MVHEGWRSMRCLPPGLPASPGCAPGRERVAPVPSWTCGVVFATRDRAIETVPASDSAGDPRNREIDLADEQAGLRRVATLIAEGAPAATVFATVAREVAVVMGARFANVSRYVDVAAALGRAARDAGMRTGGCGASPASRRGSRWTRPARLRPTPAARRDWRRARRATCAARGRSAMPPRGPRCRSTPPEPPFRRRRSPARRAWGRRTARAPS